MDERDSLLVVEDDEATRSFLADNLVADGYRVALASGAGEGLRAIEVRRPALVVLDLMLEDGNGLLLLDRVRGSDGLASRIDPELPVIVLTGRTGESDRVRAFARGADDFVAKPFLYAELLGRIRAVLRRANGRPQRGVMRVGELVVDPRTRAVRLDGRPVHLSAKEFALLQALAEEPTRVCGKNELLRDVWGYLSIGNTRRKGRWARADTRTLDANACRLRKKLALAGAHLVHNARGVGSAPRSAQYPRRGGQRRWRPRATAMRHSGAAGGHLLLVVQARSDPSRAVATGASRSSLAPLATPVAPHILVVARRP